MYVNTNIYVYIKYRCHYNYLINCKILNSTKNKINNIIIYSHCQINWGGGHFSVSVG